MGYRVGTRGEGTFTKPCETADEAFAQALALMGQGVEGVYILDPEGREWADQDFADQMNKHANASAS